MTTQVPYNGLSDPASVEAKYDVAHVESDRDDLKVRDIVTLKSGFDDLSTGQAISVFRKAVFICTIAGFAAATDGESCIWKLRLTSGYQHQLTASIIANKGFIAQFAPAETPTKLLPTHVSAWGGIYR